MTDLFNHYEQQFGNISAEITARICKIPNLHGSAKQSAVSDVERCFDEARELVRENLLYCVKIDGNPITIKEQFLILEFRNSRLKKCPKFASRARLLDNTERVERSGRQLEEGYKMCVETEQIGVDIMNNLHRDREVIERARERTRGTDKNLSKSSRILTGMMRRIIQNRIIMAVICLAILGVIGLIIYYAVK
ncbi:vesicle transport through interaction with t-SNAREs homolog 1A-like [Orbicella faveolata]|uniref:vesicle transport through interaction with t-SNAREs homolog 1A-like n=1 Tax=Orbicella faveolata TaxID=48498 RepID=UPI0009E4AED9|nr:vesicle transport through interaction with t-SNAREs homolog 1A-like [Orbicella faveolata]